MTLFFWYSVSGRQAALYWTIIARKCFVDAVLLRAVSVLDYNWTLLFFPSCFVSSMCLIYLFQGYDFRSLLATSTPNSVWSLFFFFVTKLIPVFTQVLAFRKCSWYARAGATILFVFYFKPCGTIWLDVGPEYLCHIMPNRATWLNF